MVVKDLFFLNHLIFLFLKQYYQSMFVGHFLLLVLALGMSVFTSSLPFCSRSFTPQEWHKEGESYLLNIKEFEQHLQPEPYFLSKLTHLATGKPQPFLELVYTAVAKIAPLNELYLSICALVLLLMLAFYLLRKSHQFSQITFFRQLLAEKAQTSKYLKFSIVFLLAVAAIVCLRGIIEGYRQEKAINHFLCETLSSQNFIQQSDKFIGSAELQAYINSFSARINGNNFVEMSTLQKQVRIAEYPKKNIEEIIRALQNEQSKGPVLIQLRNAKDTLEYVSQFMAKDFGYFEVDCRQKISFFLFEVFKYCSAADKLFNAVRKQRINDVHFEEIPQKVTLLVKACFTMVLVIVIAAGALILRKEQEQNKWVVHLDRLHFALSVVVVLCLATVIGTTLFLSFNFWAHQGEKELLKDPSYCYDTFSVFNNKIYAGVCRLLSPLSNETKYRTSSPFFSDVCHNVYDKYDQVTRPYLSKNQSYFYDLMVSSVQGIRNEVTRHEVLEKIETRYSKVPLIPLMKDTEAHLAFSINLEEEIQQQNINLTGLFERLTKSLATHVGNSAYAMRQICQALSTTLILILLLMNLSKWLTESAAGARLKQIEQIQQYKFNQMYAL